ncbi:hypothetical protein [Microlunatus speluncae]|uniref:hypothetical protein n=1 Tax=Microlunatus speluncae TaxID=2594267 RepID=UPI00126638A0|nr:hypothetical protein [Microlunatus speluncae]
MFGAGGYGEQFQALAQGQAAVVPIRKRRLLLYALLSLGLLVGCVLLGWPVVVKWIEFGRLDTFLPVGVLGVIVGVAGLVSTLRLLLRPRRLVLTLDRFAEQQYRHGNWTAVIDVGWEDIQSVTVKDMSHRLIRFPAPVNYTLTEAAVARNPAVLSRSMHLGFGYGPSRQLSDLLDAARLGLVG